MATDFFLKLENIRGESTDAKHKGEIELISFSWGASPPHLRPPARTPLHDFSIVKPVDAASPLLLQAACQGTSQGQAHFVARKAGTDQLEYIKIEFSDVMVSSVAWTGSSEGPVEAVTLGYGSARVSVFPIDAKGSPGAAVVGVCDVPPGHGGKR